ncbi:MAG: hypothetical protein ACLP3B_07870 [Syntrophobacteraceae bacterium]
MSNNQIKEITIEWTYIPPDYFEVPFLIEEEGYSITVDNGKATAKVEPHLYPEIDKLTRNIETTVYYSFIGVQVISHRAYSISGPKTDITRTDNSKIISLKARIDAVSVTSEVDLILSDPNGNIVSDSRQERIDKKQEWSRLAGKYMPKDATAKALFESYHAAVEDPEDELIHLYEIRDAIKKSFGEEKKVQLRLKISNAKWKKTWKRLGDLANNEPLNQGRHRGENPGTLRDATPEELQEAREIAQQLIHAYLVFLDSSS